jgi:transposase
MANSSSTDWKEMRRIRAFELKHTGWAQYKIAEAFGVSEAAISQWVRMAEEQGDQALRSCPHPGAPPRLQPTQLDLLPDFLSHGAEAYGFRGEVWTCARIGKVIEWEFGVVYHKAHVSRLMRKINWTPQIPIERATQRDELVIERWRMEKWPELLEKARREHRIIVFVDESGFYLLPGITKTYSLCGKTPMMKSVATRDHLSVMSGITPVGQLYTLVRAESLTGQESVVFLKHLQHYFSDKLLVIWDNSSIHRDNRVKAFLSQDTHNIHLEALPPYAPDLNPVEDVWQQLKHVELRNLCCLNLNHLHDELEFAIMRLRNKPHLIQTFFADAGLTLSKT